MRGHDSRELLHARDEQRDVLLVARARAVVDRRRARPLRRLEDRVRRDARVPADGRPQALAKPFPKVPYDFFVWRAGRPRTAPAPGCRAAVATIPKTAGRRRAAAAAGRASSAASGVLGGAAEARPAPAEAQARRLRHGHGCGGRALLRVVGRRTPRRQLGAAAMLSLGAGALIDVGALRSGLQRVG